MILAQKVEALVRNRHTALVRVDGAEGEVLRRRLTLRQHVEEGRFTVNDIDTRLRVGSVSADAYLIHLIYAT